MVRLFNAIAAAQGAPEKLEKEEAKKRKHDGASDAGSNATNEEGAPPPKILRRPNVLGGRGKGEARTLIIIERPSSLRTSAHPNPCAVTNLSKASFLDLIRAGTTAS